MYVEIYETSISYRRYGFSLSYIIVSFSYVGIFTIALPNTIIFETKEKLKQVFAIKSVQNYL